MSTVERTSHRTAPPNRTDSHGHLARRLAGPGWVIMTLACVWITVIVSRYLTFDPEVYFPAAARALPPARVCPRRPCTQRHPRLVDRPVPVRAAASAPVRPRAPIHGCDLCGQCHRTWGKRADPRSDRLHRPGGVCRFHRAGPGHAVHDLDGATDDLGRPLRRAPSLDDPQFLPDHGRSHVAGVVWGLRRAGRLRDLSISRSRLRTPGSPLACTTGLRRSSSPTAADSSPTAASVRPEVAVTR